MMYHFKLSFFIHMCTIAEGMLTKGPPPPPPAGSRPAPRVPSARQHGFKRLNWQKKGQHFIIVDALLHIVQLLYIQYCCAAISNVLKLYLRYYCYPTIINALK